MKRLKPFNFTVSKWRKFDVFLSFIGDSSWRFGYIVEFRKKIKKYCVGYIEAEKLWVRPKKDCYALMFYCDGIYCWAHVTKREFDILKKRRIK